MEKIDKEKFVKDIEEDLGVKKYEDKIKEEEESKNNNKFYDTDFGDLGEIFSEFFKNVNKSYKPSILDIEKICKITKEEAKEGSEKEVKIKKKYFDKKEKKLKAKKVVIKTRIPKGIKDGQALVLRGEGNEDENLNRGNLFIRIVVKK